MRQSHNAAQIAAADQRDDAGIAPTGALAGRLLGAAVGLLGLGGLLCDWLKVPQPRILDIHLLFGVVLLATVARSLVRAWPAPQLRDARSFYFHTRRVARWVYGLLYVMAAVRVGLYLLTTGGALADFQQYIGFGLLAICLIRLCAMVTTARAAVREAL